MSALVPGASAPDFKLPLIGGGEFSLRQTLAKGPVVLAFFKISCPVCQYSFPYFQRLAQALKDKGVSVVAISQDDEKNTVQFMRAYGAGFPTARDDEHGYAVSAAYGLTNVPTVFEVTSDGKIAASIVGWSKAEIEAIYAKYLDHDAADPLFKTGEQVADFRPG
ncbi:MAG: TlpA disulfide reductase family protein [Candidatus Korobacteraceae bacterium]|jgi:peroxiredoxin